MEAITQQPGHRPLRRGRWSEPGRIYSVTTTTRERKPWFADPEMAATAARETLAPAFALDARVPCWVLMPDHMHLLIELGPANSLPRVVQHVKSSLAAAVNRKAGRTGAIWDRGFHDHAVRSDEDVARLAQYLIANPVRAGLVAQVGDYPYWNTIWV